MKNKISIFLIMLISTMFSSKAQNYFDVSVVNNTSCTIDVEVEASPGVFLFTASVPGGGGTTSATCVSGIPANIRFLEGANFMVMPPNGGNQNCGGGSSVCGGSCFPTANFFTSYSLVVPACGGTKYNL